MQLDGCLFLCCNAQTNLIVVFMSCIGIVMHSLFVNCPDVIRSPSKLFIFHGEDTILVNRGPWSILLQLFTIYCNSISFIYYKQTPSSTPYIQSFVFSKTGEIDNLTIPLGQSILVVLCRIHVALTPVVAQPTSAASTSEVISFSYWFDNLGFITEGNLLVVLNSP